MENNVSAIIASTSNENKNKNHKIKNFIENNLLKLNYIIHISIKKYISVLFYLENFLNCHLTNDVNELKQYLQRLDNLETKIIQLMIEHLLSNPSKYISHKDHFFSSTPYE